MITDLPRGASLLGDLVRLRTLGRFDQEMRSFASVLGVSWRTLALANVSYNLTLAMFGCSTFAIPTPSGPVVGRNLDWFPERLLARASCLLSAQRQGQLRFRHAGWPGAIGVVTGYPSEASR